MIDGGYYAIKGFEFQIDKTILEILSSDKSVSLEDIQDINTDSFVIQVKYKETQEYSDNKIREPVLQLIEEFKNGKEKNYKLFCFFKDKQEKIEKIDIAQLNSILHKTKETEKTPKKAKELNSRIDKIDEKLKYEFINKFTIEFSKDYQEQFMQVINFIETQFNNKISEYETIYHYSNIANYLRKIVINNKDIDERSCSKNELINLIKKGKQLIFDSTFEEFRGKEQYFKFIKSKFITPCKSLENYIFIGNVEVDSSVSLENLVGSIIKSYYKKATYDIKPLTLIIHDNVQCLEVKKYLIEQEVKFNDGYETIKFSSNLFSRKAIYNKLTKNNTVTESLGDIEFKVRILTYKSFSSISEHKIEPNMIYYFNSDICQTFNKKSFVLIENITTKEIQHLFN